MSSSLGEVVTPLVPLPRIAGAPGQGGEILVKDEGRLPTGSFKARGLALAVSMAKELGIETMAMPTNGNAGAAMAAYCARAGIKSYVFCPDDTPEVNVREIAMQGAAVFLVDGLIDDCGRLVAEGEKAVGWFNCSTLREPYRIEGKKTMGIELAEQLGWELPDVIFYPTGGGTGIIGMWKAFAEIERSAGSARKRPRMVVVQAAGCAPMVKAWEDGVEHAPRWENAHTFAAGIRVPQAVGDFLILRAVRESGGFAIAVDDRGDRRRVARGRARGGAAAVPRGRRDFAAYKQALADGRVGPASAWCCSTARAGLKYPMPEAGTRLKLGDRDRLAASDCRRPLGRLRVIPAAGSVATRRPQRKIAPSRGFSARQSVHVGGGQRVAADPPVAAFHLLDHAPSDAAHVLALDRDHRVGQLADDLALLFLAEHVLDDANLNERHWISPSVLCLTRGAIVPNTLPVQ